MGKRDALVQAYVEALDLCPIMILAEPVVAKIALAPESGFGVFDILWFAKRHHAELVLMQCPDGPICRPASQVRDDVVNIAAMLGARWQTGAEVEAIAAAAVAEIIAKVEDMRIRGGLAQVNRSYKIYRQRQVAKGEKAVPYSAHLHCFTASLVRLAAQNSGAR
jgi:hypothetical protein